ncbi:hypothetical protein PHAVU_011G095800 [Phaseolus vulgaris]
MDRGKNVASNSSGSYREFTKWTVEMDQILLNAMIDEVRKGCGIDGSWTTQGYTNIVMALNEVGLSGLKKSLKDRWMEIHDLFGGLSGFAWNQTTKLFEAEDEVWSELIKVKPSAAKWRFNPIRHYDLMEELWFNDRATGSRVRTARDMNSPPDMTNFSMASSSHKRNRTRKGKSPAEDVDVPPPPTRIPEVLDYSRYFSTRRQMSSIMHTPFFAGLGFEFQNLLNWQGLQPFLGINLPYYEDLVRVFYTNAKFTPAGHLAIEICGKMIHIKEIDWMSIAHLQYDGLALSSMIREDVEGQNLKNVGSLKMNDRLLHYTWVHILCPRGSNYAQLLNEDIFMMWLIKNNVLINWPPYIMQHIIKCRDNKMPLPYANLITRILQIRSGMVLCCNFFKWCIEDVADEKDEIIIIQQNKICLLENRLKVSTRRIQMLLLGMSFLFLINIIMFFM